MVRSRGWLDDAPLTDAEAYLYLASNPELIERYGDMEWGFYATQYAAEHVVKTGCANG